MQKVITVNLNGNAYQLEETAYAALRAYLDRAELQLKDNPDRAEIIADLEQAIADKCRRFLGPHKTVVATAEIEQIVAEMGPVEGSAEPSAGAAAPDSGSASSSQTRTETDAPKRLYRIVDGAMISGVCAGLAAYTHINIVVIRLIFIILLFATGGAFALIYLGLMFILPPATTSEEHAAAYGMPFNAQELVDQAKQYSEQFKKGAQQFKEGAFQNNWEWRRQWRQQRRDFRRHIRQQRWMWRRGAWAPPSWSPPGPVAPAAAPVSYAGYIVTGIMLPIVSVLNAAFFVVVIIALISLVSDGTLLGVALPEHLSHPVAILAVVAVFAVVTVPLRSLRRASYYALGGAHYGAVAAWDGLLGVGLVVLFGWLAYQYIPEVHELVRNLPAIIDSLTQRAP